MWIAHISANGPASPEVVIGPADAPDRRWPVAPRGRYPKWTAGGRELLFLEAGAIHRVVIDPATGLPVGRPAPWLELPATVRPAALQIAPDWRFLMLESVDALAPARDSRRSQLAGRRAGENPRGPHQAAPAVAPDEARTIFKMYESVGAGSRWRRPAEYCAVPMRRTAWILNRLLRPPV